jgi:hypothetical protein
MQKIKSYWKSREQEKSFRNGALLIFFFPWSLFVTGYALYEVTHPEEITPDPIFIQQEVQPEEYIIPDPCGLEAMGGCEMTVEDIIRTEAIAAGIDPDTAIRIATCESSLNPYARNEASSAQGLFQFLPSTWEWIGSPGDPYNPYDATRAFAEWYPTHPHWWNASKDCWRI